MSCLQKLGFYRVQSFKMHQLRETKWGPGELLVPNVYDYIAADPGLREANYTCICTVVKLYFSIR
jgi:hypothetical protein